MAALLERYTDTLRNGAEWLVHAERIRFEVAQVLTSMNELGRGIAGFDRTQDRSWFDAAVAADLVLPHQVAELESTVAADPTERELTAELTSLARLRQRQTALARESALQGAKQNPDLWNDESRHILDSARNLANQLQTVEARVLTVHREEVEAARWRLKFGIGVTAVITVLLLSTMAILTLVENDRRRRFDAERNAERNAARRSSEARFQTIFDLSPVGVSLLRPIRTGAGDIVDFAWSFINQAGASMLGHPADQLVGRQITHIFPTVWERPGLFQTLARCAEGDVVQSLESNLTITGAERSYYQVVSRVGDELLVWFADLTERTLAARKIEERERRFAALADAMPQHVWTATPTGLFDYVNRRWREYTGLSPEDSRDPARHLDIVHPEERELTLSTWKESLARGTSYEIEHRLRATDGNYRWFLCRAVAELDETGRVVGWFGTGTDIDDSKQVAKTLAEADRRKDEFLATLSHELRNPLAPIRNAAQILSSPQLSPTQLHWAQSVIRRQVKHMAWLLDDLLDVARITQGKLELKRQSVQLAGIVDAAVEAARPLIDAKRHELRVRLPLRPVMLYADPVRLSQVVCNLLTNAAKYTEPGGRIDCRADTDGRELRLCVADNGIGIAPEHVGSLFNMFSQIDHGSHRTEGGLGIGLSLVKGLTELHDGTVQAASAGPGQGSVFTVVLPLAAGAESTPQTQTPAPPSNGRRVLVADDNRDAADSLAMVLELSGHEVRVAHGGSAAIDVARDFRPEIALLDIGMPGMDGYDVARLLRSEPWAEGLRMIALTGWGQERDRQLAQAAGFDHHLTKPVDTEVLQRVLMNDLASRATDPVMRASTGPGPGSG